MRDAKRFGAECVSQARGVSTKPATLLRGGGGGVGGCLPGLWKQVPPRVAAAGRAVAHHIGEAGLGVLADLTTGAVPLAASLKKHTRTARKKLGAKLKKEVGKMRKAKRPIKRGAQSKKRQSVKALPTGQITKSDIFGPKRK